MSLINKESKGVYSITNIINNKIYVGSAVRSFRIRWNTHKSELKRNVHKNIHLQRAYNKYGKENFVFEIIEEHESEFCISAEQYWINMLDTCNSKYGYNILGNAHNCSGRIVTKETRLKISIGNKDKKLTVEHIKRLHSKLGTYDTMKGKHHTEEAKKKISTKLIGKSKMSEEGKKRLSESLKGNKHTLGIIKSTEVRLRMSNSRKGIKFTDEHKQNMSKVRIGKKMSEETKKKLSIISKNYWKNKLKT